MKKILLGLMTIVMMAFVCVSFASCGGDDDDNGGGGSSSSGVSANAKYGYFIKNGNGSQWELSFCSLNLNSTPNPGTLYDMVIIDLVPGQSYSDIPTGEFTGCFAVDMGKGAKAFQTEGTVYESGSRSNTTGKLTISKNGNNYTVSYTGVTLYQYDDNDNRVGDGIVSSFSFTGPIVDYPDVDDWEYDDK